MSVFENDFIKRQIESMSDMLGKMFLRKEDVEVLEEDALGDDEVKKYFHKIKEQIEAMKYPEAMAILQSDFANGNMEYLKVALYFFDVLNAKSEEELKEGNYSRNSLYNDLSFISDQFGIKL
ncbi:MAG: DUF6483 family protein [Longicatena sp.]